MYRDERTGTNTDLASNPPSEEGTMTNLPAYRESQSPLDKRQSSLHKSTNLSSTGSSSDITPDVHPFTHHTFTPDDGKEVFIASPTSSQASPFTTNSASYLATKSYREYNFYYTNALTHLIICDPDSRALYFAEMSAFAKGVPDVSLRDIANAGFDDLAAKGSSLGHKEAQDTPVIATADAIPNSKHIKLGIGDPLQPETSTWMVLRNVHDDPKAKSRKYDMLVKHRNGTETNYQWIQGVSTDADSGPVPVGKARTKSSNSKEAFRMISEQGLVASFRNASATTFKKRGSLRVYELEGGGEGMSKEMLMLVILTCAALCERARRAKVKKSLLLGL